MREQKQSPLLWILIGGGVIAVVVGGIAIAVVLVLVFPGKTGSSGGINTAKPLMTRDEFTRSVMGKSADEVIAAVGKPDRTSKSGTSETWFYDEKTTDSVTGKVDITAYVNLKDGVVYHVHF